MGKITWTTAQQDAIVSRDRAVAVSAAAGSGKTAVLTRRMIERICAPDGSGDLSRLLVVTFTKAAASELVSRIADALADELAKNPENRHIQSQSLLISSAHISTIQLLSRSDQNQFSETWYSGRFFRGRRNGNCFDDETHRRRIDFRFL